MDIAPARSAERPRAGRDCGRPSVRGTSATVLLLLVLPLPIAGCTGARAPALLGGNPEVDAIFAAYDRPDSPGCSLGVIREGELVYGRGYGMANLEHDVPNGTGTVFRIASVSKQFVGMLVLLLEEEGALSLEDDVRRWLPELPDFGEPIRVSHLLHHTSGLRDYLVLMSLAGYRDEDYYTAPELIEVLSRQRELNFAPGAEHLYSNTGYFLLGQIVERATGTSLAEAAERRIFGPLGMAATHFHDDLTRIVPERATGYAAAPDGEGWRISMTGLPIVGDGAVFTSVDDLVAWDRNFYDNRLGSGDNELIARWLQPGLLRGGGYTSDEPGTTYGAGITTGTHRGARVVMHGGAFVGYRAEMLRFPEHRLGVVTLCNVASARPTEMALRVAEVYLGEVLPAPEPGSATTTTGADAGGGEARGDYLLPLAELRGFVGRYVSPELQTTYLLSVEDGRLVWEIPGRFRSVLAPRDQDRFRGENLPATFRFARNSRGEIGGFLLDAGRVKNLWFERVGP